MTNRQTVTIAGKRTVLTTRNGRVTAKPAAPLEWQLQAAQVRRLRGMPEYGAPPQGMFLLAGDMNAGKRGAKAQVQAKATGMEPGEPDLRIYLVGGKLRLIENKVGRATLTDSQKDRHPKLAALGHPVTVLRADSEEDAADQAETLVRAWLREAAPAAANDNEPAKATAATAESDWRRPRTPAQCTGG